MTISSKILKTMTVTALTTMGSFATVHAQTDFPNYQVVSTTNGKIRAGVLAFKKGDLDKAAMFMRSSLKDGMSPKREAIAQSNLCAIYGAMGESERAAGACKKALKLRPSFAPALANNNVLQKAYAKK